MLALIRRDCQSCDTEPCHFQKCGGCRCIKKPKTFLCVWPQLKSRNALSLELMVTDKPSCSKQNNSEMNSSNFLIDCILVLQNQQTKHGLMGDDIGRQTGIVCFCPPRYRCRYRPKRIHYRSGSVLTPPQAGVCCLLFKGNTGCPAVLCPSRLILPVCGWATNCIMEICGCTVCIDSVNSKINQCRWTHIYRSDCPAKPAARHALPHTLLHG